LEGEQLENGPPFRSAKFRMSQTFILKNFCFLLFRREKAGLMINYTYIALFSSVVIAKWAK
jgi:hypothetical protein